jgi:hypothetical protein
MESEELIVVDGCPEEVPSKVASFEAAITDVSFIASVL